MGLWFLLLDWLHIRYTKNYWGGGAKKWNSSTLISFFWLVKENSTWDLHLLDSIVIDSLDVLRAVDQEIGDKMPKALKHIPAKNVSRTILDEFHV